MIFASRYHDISMGHRVYGHEGKCAHLHGHNYRFHFTIKPNAGLDSVGRVVDFSVIKSTLCEWLEENWDHKFLVYEKDPYASMLRLVDWAGVVVVPFNPTAEEIATYFVEVIAPALLKDDECELVELVLNETEKCSVTYKKDAGKGIVINIESLISGINIYDYEQVEQIKYDMAARVKNAILQAVDDMKNISAQPNVFDEIPFVPDDKIEPAPEIIYQSNNPNDDLPF